MEDKIQTNGFKERELQEIEYVHKQIESLNANERIKEILVALNNDGTTDELLAFLYEICLFDFEKTENKNHLRGVKSANGEIVSLLDMRFNQDKGEVKITIAYADEKGNFPIDVNDRTALVVDKNGNCTFGNETYDDTLLKLRIDRERIDKDSLTKVPNIEGFIRSIEFDKETEQQLIALLAHPVTGQIVENIATYPEEEYEKYQGGNEWLFIKQYGEKGASTESFRVKKDQGTLLVEISQHDEEKTTRNIDYKLEILTDGTGRIDYLENDKPKRTDRFILDDGEITDFSTEIYEGTKKLG